MMPTQEASHARPRESAKRAPETRPRRKAPRAQLAFSPCPLGALQKALRPLGRFLQGGGGAPESPTGWQRLRHLPAGYKAPDPAPCRQAEAPIAR